MSQTEHRILDWPLPASDVRGKPFTGPGAPKWRFAHFARIVVGGIFIAIYRTRFVGEYHVPEGACILAGNHSSTFDPFMIYGRSPKGMIHFIAKKELWKHRAVGWAVDHLGAIPVYRGTADRQMIKMTTDLLKAGEKVGIYPEGTRVYEAGPDGHGDSHGGTAFLSILSGAPVVPHGIGGIERIMPKGTKIPHFPRVVYSFGAPIYPGEFEGSNRERVEAMTAAIMDSIVRERERARAMSEGRMPIGEE